MWGEDLLTNEILVGAACKVKKKKKNRVIPAEPLMVLCLHNQYSAAEKWSMYSKAAPVPSLIRTQGENQARRRQTYENIQLLPFGFTISRSGSISCPGRSKEKRWLSTSDQDVLQQWCKPTWNKASKKDETQLQEKNQAVIREDGREQKEKQTQPWTYQLDHDGRWGGNLTPVETMVRSHSQVCASWE